MAVEDLEAAYKACLLKQADYCLTTDEKYFECFGAMLRTLHYNSDILSSNNQNNEHTEEDVVVKIWSTIFKAFFGGTGLRLKWGDSVDAASTTEKKKNFDEDKRVIGDKVDLRVISQSGHDVANVEFARNASETKYYQDHSKILRESKIISDQVYSSKIIPHKLKRTIKARCIQISASEGEIMETMLVDDGLYISKKIGALRLPSSALDMDKMIILFERLEEIKRGALYINHVHNMIKKHEQSVQHSLDKNRGFDPTSPYDNNNNNNNNKNQVTNETQYTSWTRGSWFPPAESRDTPFTSDFPNSLLSPLNKR